MSVLLIFFLFCPFWFGDLDFSSLPLFQEFPDHRGEGYALQRCFGFDSSVQVCGKPHGHLVLADHSLSPVRTICCTYYTAYSAGCQV